MKTILDLCEALPDSEPELRERADEFNKEIAEKVMGWRVHCDPAFFVTATGDICCNRSLWYPMGSITDAKAATDALIGRGFRIRIECAKGWWNVWLYWPLDSTDPKGVTWIAAPDEPLARSAAAYLAAMAEAFPLDKIRAFSDNTHA